MAQPNVAREPSMDEILASIRKIIESNEPQQAAIEISGRNTASGRVTTAMGRDERKDEEIGLTIDDALLAHDFSNNSMSAGRATEPAPVARSAASEAARLGVPASPFSSTQQTSPEPLPSSSLPSSPAQASAATQSPLSLADIAARVRAASERNATAPRDAAPRAEDASAASPQPAAPYVAAPSQSTYDTNPVVSVSPAAPAAELAPFDALQALANIDVEPSRPEPQMDDQFAAVLASFAEAADEAVADAIEDAKAERADLAAEPAMPAADAAPASVEHVADAAPASVEHAADEHKASAEPISSSVATPEPVTSAAPAETATIAHDRPVPAAAAAPIGNSRAPAFAAEPAAVRAPAAPPAELAASVGALVSPAVSNQVAQSFGALADAVDYKNRTSFDDMAREMLRPMLQEWLDDNLPTLVERLVREEIERVARGGAR
ncbi:Cell pole-organizing protein PopZ [Rhizobium sp. RU20A]|uniref:PopZ family protein n=1 Tax=Rhizobium sp. RU20A TaxID=1907412 RepID=UPI000955F208|nr:DUF2497 domain-containing protein [Rhizobium sp. RU20A]SIQ01467.1 Cell pole-organizing protein PopZ [Rhizobium sp. RU20A]